MIISVYNRDSNEYAKLATAAELLNIFSPAKFKFTIEDIYFNAEQDLLWTTIICDCGSALGGFQALTPWRQEEVLLADSLKEMAAIVSEILEEVM